TLTAAYRKADYFARNVRTIQVLIERDAILTGAAAAGGQQWKYYDLTDDERAALEGDRDAITVLAQRLADIPTPAGPTPNNLIALTDVHTGDFSAPARPTRPQHQPGSQSDEAAIVRQAARRTSASRRRELPAAARTVDRPVEQVDLLSGRRLEVRCV